MCGFEPEFKKITYPPNKEAAKRNTRVTPLFKLLKVKVFTDKTFSSPSINILQKKAPHTRRRNHTTRSSNAPINHHIVISPFYSVGFGIERYHSQERIQSTSL